MQVVRANGLEIVCERVGEGPPLVLNNRPIGPRAARLTVQAAYAGGEAVSCQDASVSARLSVGVLPEPIELLLPREVSHKGAAENVLPARGSGWEGG